MSYVTLKVEINHGKIVPSEPAKLPETGKGFLTILPGDLPVSGVKTTQRSAPRPIGLAKNEFTVPADFNAPLSEDILKSFEGE